MKERHYYTSLTRNMTLVVVLVSFTPLILIAGLIGYYCETFYRDEVMAHLQELVEKHQQNINSYLDEKLSYIKVMADSYTYDDLTSEAFLENKLVILQNAYSGVFVDLGVVNSAGIQISYAGNLKLLTDRLLQGTMVPGSHKERLLHIRRFLGSSPDASLHHLCKEKAR